MQSQPDFCAFKNLRLVLGNHVIEKLQQMTILLVGVGGIGCQVLKNLSKLPIKRVVIIDFDVIEMSNLNRQFYFRKEHLQRSKAKVAKDQIQKIVPNLNIEAIEGSIYDKKYDNYNFYQQFDLIISALDNMEARQHLARNCTRYGKVLIDAGTSGFNGQSYANIRFETSCHNCHPSKHQQNFAVCTIRTKPERSIHCAVYAKNFYEQFFSQENDDFLHKEIQQLKKKIFEEKDEYKTDQKIQQLGIQLFDYLFYRQFKNVPNVRSQENDFSVNILPWQEAMKLDKILQNTALPRMDDEILSLKELSIVFLSSLINLIKRKLNKDSIQKIPPDRYDKDDSDCTLLVYSIANLRIYNFRNQNQLNSKLKCITLQQCRRMIGKLIPAIASTNSVASSLEIKLLKDFVCNNILPPKYLTISPYSSQKISFSWLSLPNPECEVCSPKNLYFQVACDLGKRTFEEFEQFAKEHCYSYDRDVYCQNFVLIKNINKKKVSPNKKKHLNFKPDMVVENTLTLKYQPTSKISNLNVQIVLIDIKEPLIGQNKFKILNQREIDKTISSLFNQIKPKNKTDLGGENEQKEEENKKEWQYVQIQ